MNKILLIIIISFKFSSIAAQTTIIQIKEIIDKKLIQTESKGFLIQVSYHDYRKIIEPLITENSYDLKSLISNLDNYFLKSDVLDSKYYLDLATKSIFLKYYEAYLKECFLYGNINILKEKNKLKPLAIIHIKQTFITKSGSDCYQDEFFLEDKTTPIYGNIKCSTKIKKK